MSLIAALDRGRAIGRNGAMPWHLPDDLKRFKRLTTGKHVLMGHRTAEAIGRALPGRRNLVLSRRHEAPYQDQETVRSLDEVRALAEGNELMVIGGGEIYHLLLPLADRMYLTRVDARITDADTFFPEPGPSDWIETAREHHAADARHVYAFDFVDYARS